MNVRTALHLDRLARLRRSMDRAVKLAALNRVTTSDRAGIAAQLDAALRQAFGDSAVMVQRIEPDEPLEEVRPLKSVKH